MQHVMLDLYGCDPDGLADEAFLRGVLDEYPRHIGMEKVGPVELRYIKTSNPLDDGYSGFVIIATSHVSLHAWAPYGMVNIDIFSCEPFDEADVVAFASEMFQTADVEVHSVQRATRSPRPSTRQVLQRNVGARAKKLGELLDTPRLAPALPGVSTEQAV
jgi:S-adenosylmethionine decarboxylase